MASSPFAPDLDALRLAVALADSLGDVWDALLDQSSVMYRPGVKPASTIDLKVLGNGANGSAAHLS